MGTQQIIVIVLSIIIVGVGVTVGIKLFQSQAYNSNRLAIANEMQQYVKAGIQYWKTPVNMGGAGTDSGNIVLEDIALAMGFQMFRGGPYDNHYGATSDNGNFIVVGLDKNILTLKGLGEETKGKVHPMVLMKLNLDTFICETTYGDEEGF
jgi:hypothetical protein